MSKSSSIVRDRIAQQQQSYMDLWYNKGCTFVRKRGNSHATTLIWHPDWVRLAPNGTNLGLFKIRFSIFSSSHLEQIWVTLFTVPKPGNPAQRKRVSIYCQFKCKQERLDMLNQLTSSPAVFFNNRLGLSVLTLRVVLYNDIIGRAIRETSSSQHNDYTLPVRPTAMWYTHTNVSKKKLDGENKTKICTHWNQWLIPTRTSFFADTD